MGNWHAGFVSGRSYKSGNQRAFDFRPVQRILYLSDPDADGYLDSNLDTYRYAFEFAYDNSD